MEKSKSSRSGDRLSKLPDSLIFMIFWLLPITDVVRTTILSKSWKDFWTKSPFLNFDQCAIDRDSLYYDIDEFQHFVNRVLILWRGVRVVKFKIKLELEYYTQSLVRNICVWLRFAKEKQVEELHLELLNEDDAVDLELGCIYSCSSLKLLRLRGCRVQILGNLKWDRLKSLILHGNGLNQSAITKFLGGSPKLEVLIWTSCNSNEDLCIRSSSLKKLSIDNYLDDDDDDIPRRTELKIRTPNLNKLEISGPPYEKFLLNVPSLSDLTLRFCAPYQSNAYDLDWFLEESLKQILPTIQRVHRVTLSDWCVEVLEDMNKKCLLPPLFPECTFLKLNVMYSKYVPIASLLRIFPELKSLVIEDENKYDLRHGRFLNQQDLLEFEAPNSFLMQLSTVDVTWAKGGYAIFSFIEIVLKYASKLEKMVFRVKTTFDITERHAVSRELLMMARSSPTAQLVFCEY